MPLVDLHLDLNGQAWAVLHMIASRQEDGPEGFLFRTRALYGGRERGAAILVEPLRGDRRLVLWVYEHRVSDDLVVTEWEMPAPVPPVDALTVADIPALAWERSARFEYGRAGDAAVHIVRRIEAWTQTHVPTGRETP